jgi:hypothetical protein
VQSTYAKFLTPALDSDLSQFNAGLRWVRGVELNFVLLPIHSSWSPLTEFIIKTAHLPISSLRRLFHPSQPHGGCDPTINYRLASLDGAPTPKETSARTPSFLSFLFRLRHQRFVVVVVVGVVLLRLCNGCSRLLLTFSLRGTAPPHHCSHLPEALAHRRRWE